MKDGVTSRVLFEHHRRTRSAMVCLIGAHRAPYLAARHVSLIVGGRRANHVLLVQEETEG